MYEWIVVIQPLLDAELLVNDLRDRRQAVRRARRVRDDLVFGGVVLVVVDAEDDGDVGALGRRGDDDLLRARGEVLCSRVPVGEEPRRLEHDVDAEVLPRQLGRVALRQHLELVAVDRDGRPSLASTRASRLPSTESYLSRCASV